MTIDPDDTANAVTVAQSLAHELGHANFTPEAHTDFGSLTRDAYIRENTMHDLRDEAEATIAELIVRDELAANGTDMPISGSTASDKIAAWERYKNGEISRAQLVDEIANLFATGEHPSNAPSQTYWDYYSQTYADFWDQNHP